jgi:glycosyltransferase involved in cell wall biosynthesis
VDEQKAISVITPVYNGEKYIRECIESVRDQPGVTIEHIVVDDGSTDATASIASEYDNITFLRQDRKGATAARNRALEVAGGEYLKFLDADDLLVIGCLENQLRKAAVLGPREIAYGYCEAIFESGERLLKKRPDTPTGVNIVCDCIIRNILTSLPLYPIEAVRSVGGFDNRMIARQEWNLNIKLACQGFEFKFDDVFVYKYRLHSAPERISNRVLILEDELRNLEWAFESIAEIQDHQVIDAWASILWRVGRHFLSQGDIGGAMVFFNRAKDLSPDAYKRFFSRKYRIATTIFGPIRAGRLSNWLAGRRKRSS